MARPTRKAAAKPVKYTADGPSDDDDVEWAREESREDATDAHEDDADAWSQGDDSDAPVAKKARRSTGTTAKAKGKGKATSKIKGKGKAGKLSAFIAMPLDVLVEIARYLDPVTLLYMSRANKLMHGVFASRSAAPIWSIVRANVYFPELEATDISDMQVASLVYERNCHICGRGRASIVDYALRKRWCKDCKKINLQNATRLRTLIDGLHPKALECSLFTFQSVSGYNRYRKPYYCQPDVQAMSDHLHELDDQVAAAQRDAARGKRAAKRNGKGKEKAVPEEEEEVDDEADEDLLILDKFVQQRRAIVAAAQKDGAEIVKWERSSAATRQQADTDAREARKAAITDKLVAMGYDKVDCTFSYYSEVSKQVNQPTRLNDTIWNRISAKVITHVERQKSERLVRERMKRLRERRNAFRPRYNALLDAQDGEAHTTFPSFDVFSVLPSVEALWVPDDSELVTDEEWDAALPAIIEDVDTARRVIKVGFARYIVRTLAKTDAPVDTGLVQKLEAPAEAINPTSVLLSSFGDTTMGYWGDLERGKIDLGDTAESVSDAEFDSLFSQLICKFAYQTYTSKTLHAFPEVHAKLHDANQTGLPSLTSELLFAQLMRQQLDVLKRTKLSNDRASEAKLERLGAVFKCHRCAEARATLWHHSGTANVRSDSLTWREVIAHALEYHPFAYRDDSDLYGTRVRPEIRLMTQTYPPDPPKPTPMVPDSVESS
ncbi:hypothetical protein JCM10450v2_001345 [Rhodotorula kratochvilovae]